MHGSGPDLTNEHENPYKPLTLFSSDFPPSRHPVNTTASVSLVFISAKWALMWPPSHFPSGIKVVRFNPLPQSECFLWPLTCSFNDIWSPEERKWATKQLKQSVNQWKWLFRICRLLLLLGGLCSTGGYSRPVWLYRSCYGIIEYMCKIKMESFWWPWHLSPL